MPTRRPFPNPAMRYAINPPEDGYRTPSFTTV